MGRHSRHGRQQATTSNQLTISDSIYLQTFAKHRHFYDFYIQTGEIVNFNGEIQSELLNAYRLEFNDPYYNYSSTCPVCVVEFLIKVYRAYINKIA